MTPENRKDIDVLQGIYNIVNPETQTYKKPCKNKYSQSSEGGGGQENTANIMQFNKVKKNNDFTSKTRVYNSPLYRRLRLWESLPTDLQK